MFNSEVKLVSFQFLGLASFVANALASSGAPLTEDDKRFINDTTRIVTEHLVRWANDYQIDRLVRTSKATIADIKYNDSFLLFSDQDLWQLTIYAELAGLRQWQGRHGMRIDISHDMRLKKHLKALLQAFAARTLIFRVPNARLSNTDMADLDRGYWKRMPANTYAGYEARDKPVLCAPGMLVRVSSSAAVPRKDTGWDLSHARRLVQAMDAIERNRQAMKSVFSLAESRMPNPALPKAFSATLVNSVWNGSIALPLFSNYWSGANGWFGAFYDAGTRSCSEGMPPYAMTDSFPTGGYVTWSRYSPILETLGRRLYDLVNSQADEDVAFIESYYPTLGKAIPAEYKATYMMMFLSSLVKIPVK